MATIEKHVTRQLVTVNGATPCNEAARLMVDRHVGSVAVLEDGRIVGIATERDIIRQVVVGAAGPDIPVREAMRGNRPTVTPRTTELTCLALMRDHGTRYLLVTDGDEVAGIISMRDLIRLMLDDKEWLIGQLSSFIQGYDAPSPQPKGLSTRSSA